MMNQTERAPKHEPAHKPVRDHLEVLGSVLYCCKDQALLPTAIAQNANLAYRACIKQLLHLAKYEFIEAVVMNGQTGSLPHLGYKITMRGAQFLKLIVKD